MNEIYIPKYFQIEELVYPEYFAEHKGMGDLLFNSLDVRVLVTADRLRERYGKITVNNWKWGGDRTESGLRSMNTSTGAKLSQHKFGRALDLIFHGCTADEVRADIKEMFALQDDSIAPEIEFITCIEEFPGMSWFHFDVRNHDARQYGLKVVGG